MQAKIPNCPALIKLLCGASKGSSVSRGAQLMNRSVQWQSLLVKAASINAFVRDFLTELCGRLQAPIPQHPADLKEFLDKLAISTDDGMEKVTALASGFYKLWSTARANSMRPPSTPEHFDLVAAIVDPERCTDSSGVKLVAEGGLAAWLRCLLQQHLQAAIEKFHASPGHTEYELGEVLGVCSEAMKETDCSI